ncbi:DciA family protein [Azonexus sp.]|uniref:DciA family protein n=1 Tax=Azonexus sp. TaxID=1872668 RepID=UPI0039E4CC6E
MYQAPEHFLSTDAAASRLLRQAKLIGELSRRFSTVAPSALAASARVANFRAGKVVILAENGAVAVKLRQMGQRLCTALSYEGAECNEIEIKVQPQQTPFRSMSSTIKPISQRSLAQLESATTALPEGALRRALETLLKRCARAE